MIFKFFKYVLVSVALFISASSLYAGAETVKFSNWDDVNTDRWLPIIYFESGAGKIEVPQNASGMGGMVFLRFNKHRSCSPKIVFEINGGHQYNDPNPVVWTHNDTDVNMNYTGSGHEAISKAGNNFLINQFKAKIKVSTIIRNEMYNTSAKGFTKTFRDLTKYCQKKVQEKKITDKKAKDKSNNAL
jgi:hypothetical protein